jgi:chemotaxis protein MotB
MAKQTDRPIYVVKRKRKGRAGHHGGAWKVAYADFVTAMMAFFMVSLTGHTDIRPYPSPNYSNWELSADRANAARRALERGGLASDKVARIVGLSSSVLFDKDHPEDPINRRISIIVMTKAAEESALKTDSPLHADAAVAPVPEQPVDASAAIQESPPLASTATGTQPATH